MLSASMSWIAFMDQGLAALRNNSTLRSIPGLPLAEANLAGRRLQWALEHVQHDQRPAVQHTLAVVRLRQGLVGEAESVCADVLKTELTPSQRATVLATVAMARHRAGTEAIEALDEAIALDPEAELIAEAVTLLVRPPGSQPSSNATQY
jgi:hypothetical protein